MDFFIIVVIIYFVIKFINWVNNENSSQNNNKTAPKYEPPSARPQISNPQPQASRPISQTSKPNSYNGDDILINIGVLGILLAKVDGKAIEREIKLVFDWIRNKVSASYAESKISIIKNYIQYISNDDLNTSKIKSEINRYLKVIKTDCSLGMKYEVLELYVDIIIVDNILHNNEKAAIYHVAKNIGVDMDKFLDQFHEKLPKSLLISAIDESTLGISPDMNDDQKKKILREQYRKWADLVTSDNESVRRKAEIMLELISKERLKLKNY
jgi:hypothetical protein